MGVEPTERRFPDVPLALKARRVTGPYSLPHPDYNCHSVGREHEIRAFSRAVLPCTARCVNASPLFCSMRPLGGIAFGLRDAPAEPHRHFVCSMRERIDCSLLDTPVGRIDCSQLDAPAELSRSTYQSVILRLNSSVTRGQAIPVPSSAPRVLLQSNRGSPVRYR